MTDRELIAALMAAFEDYALAFVVNLMDRSQMGVQATHKVEVRERLIEAVIAVVEASKGKTS